MRRSIFLLTVATEFGRVLATASRRIFEEFYARQGDTDFVPRDLSGRDPIDIELRLRAWRAAWIKTLMLSALSTIIAVVRETSRRAGGQPVRNPRTRRNAGRKNHVRADV